MELALINIKLINQSYCQKIDLSVFAYLYCYNSNYKFYLTISLLLKNIGNWLVYLLADWSLEVYKFSNLTWIINSTTAMLQNCFAACFLWPNLNWYEPEIVLT